MKRFSKLLCTSLILAFFTLLLAACSVDGENDNDSNTQSSQKYTVTFDTGVSGLDIPSETVSAGKKILSPYMEYRDGYRLIGWRAADETELFDFSRQITKNLHLCAVWEKEEDGHIYDQGTALSIIHDQSTGAQALAEYITNTLKTSNTVGLCFGSYTEIDEGYHEIVIGNTEREISKKAYARLGELTDEGEMIAYLIYSDGKSVALAYTEAEERLAFTMIEKIFTEKYIKEELTLDAGIYESYNITPDAYYLELDEKNRTEAWSALENYLLTEIGEAAAESFVSALKDLYSIYKPEMTEWYAKLYDPEIGGYYYSNSARDNETVTYKGETYPLLPDIESTNQALNFIISSQMSNNYAKDLPLFMREQIVAFVKSCQDSETGYFYHPQWPKSLTDAHTSRRSRDLGWAENILQKFGAKPYYTTPGGMVGENAKSQARLTLPLADSGISLVSRVIPCSLTNANIENKESFEAYLLRLETNPDRNIKQHSYHVGNELTSQTYEILERDKQLAESGADYSLMDILIKWLNKHQNEETGCWQKTQTSDPYYAVNGLLKISGIYNSAKVPMQNARAAAKSAIAAITLDEPLGAVVDIYNPWFTIGNILKNLRNYGTQEDQKYADSLVNELRLSAPSAILKSKEKISVFQKPDGSFSYGPMHSSSTSQGMPVSIINSYEGDINATGIASTGLIGYLMQALELNSYKPPLFGKTEFRKYIGIIEKKNAEILNQKLQTQSE